MALATTCPQCKTSFKVVPDQLKLRRGLVRCGVCQHVFSGIDYLRYVDDAARAAQRAARERAAAGGLGAPAGGPGAPAGGPGAPAGEPGAASAPPPPGAVPASPPPAAVPASPPPVDSSGRPAAPEHGAPAAGERLRPTETAAFAPTQPAPPAGTGQAASSATGPAAPSPTPTAASTRTEAAFVPPDADDAGLPPSLEPSPAAAPFEARSAIPSVEARPAAAPFEARSAVRSVEARPAAPAPTTTPAANAPGAGAWPALPAPDAARVPLEELLSRPDASWRSAAGPQTIIDPDGDLKTAFFLTDSSFGPLPPDGADTGPPTSTRRPGAAREVPAQAASASALAPGAGRSALPGLPLRPERGDSELGPAFVPTPPVPFEPAPRRLGAPPAEPAIDYFAGNRRRGGGLGLALSPAAWAAAIGLSALLGLQALVGWRDTIAARVPLVAPTLAGLFAPFGLAVGPPRELDALTIEGFELQAAGAPNTLALSAVLRNRSGHVVGYPAMELTLTDGTGALLVRKAITAQLYVGDPTTTAAGLAARSERPIRLTLQHDGLQPTGYQVALFYP
jgi:predicted Zn finger-like uncharacterized protein